MQASVATVTIVGIAPYTQSRQHDEPKLEGEQPDAYDARTWRSKMTTEVRDGKPTVIISATALHKSIVEAGRYSGKKIEGQAGKTWTKKFAAGLAISDGAALNIDPNKVLPLVLSVNSDGRRNGGTRVIKRFPSIPAGWSATFEAFIFDPIITKDVFSKALDDAGMFVGIGQYRPQNEGNNGRFRIEKLIWADNRKMAA